MKSEHGLIEAIYDAAVDPSRWEDVVKHIVQATKSLNGGLHIQHGDTVDVLASHNSDPFYVKLYLENWQRWNRDYFFPDVLAPPGEVRASTSICQSEVFRASPIFNELMRPQGIGDGIAIGLLFGPSFSGYFILHRSSDAVWVEPPEWRFLEILAPHLKRAAEVHQLLARAKATTDSLGAAVAAAGFAAFLLTSDRKIIFANAKAEDLLQRGVGLRYMHGRFTASPLALATRLEALVRDAARPNKAENDIAGTLVLPCGENRPPLIAHVFPVAANHTASIFDIDRPAVAVLVADPTTDFHAQIQRFASRFGLTPAELRFMGEIIGGNGLLAVATKFGISEATARTHMKRIFDKTGTHRQAELVRRFFETTLPGSPSI